MISAPAKNTSETIDDDYWTNHSYIITSFHIWTDIFHVRIEKPLVVQTVLRFLKHPCIRTSIPQSHWFKANSLVHLGF